MSAMSPTACQSMPFASDQTCTDHTKDGKAADSHGNKLFCALLQHTDTIDQHTLTNSTRVNAASGAGAACLLAYCGKHAGGYAIRAVAVADAALYQQHGHPCRGQGTETSRQLLLNPS